VPDEDKFINFRKSMSKNAYDFTKEIKTIDNNERKYVIGMINIFELISKLMMGAFNPFFSIPKKETNLIVKGLKKELIERFSEELNGLKARYDVYDFIIKVVIPVKDNVVTLTMEINEILGGVSLIFFTRNKGDNLSFNSFYRKFLEKIKDIDLMTTRHNSFYKSFEEKKEKS
jgi:hypothetical protein